MEMNELEELPDINSLCKKIPEYNSEGQLPFGDFAPSKNCFNKHFVESSDENIRGDIYKGWQRHGKELQKAGVDKNSLQLLNGSFTSNKSNPGDIDIAVEVKIDTDFISFVSDNPKILSLFSRNESKNLYSCDAFPIFVLPKDDPDYKKVTEEAIKYWTDWFGKDRNNNIKGRVWSLIGEHP